MATQPIVEPNDMVKVEGAHMYELTEDQVEQADGVITYDHWTDEDLALRDKYIKMVDATNKEEADNV